MSLLSRLRARFRPLAVLHSLYVTRYTCAFHCRDGHGYATSTFPQDAPPSLKCPVCEGHMRPDSYQDQRPIPVLVDNSVIPDKHQGDPHEA